MRVHILNPGNGMVALPSTTAPFAERQRELGRRTIRAIHAPAPPTAANPSAMRFVWTHAREA